MFLLASLALAADDQPWMERAFVIAASEKDYATALAKAASLADSTGIRLDLRGVGYDPATKASFGGLTLAPEGCRDNGFEYPCYVPRGRWDGGTYLSVEHTSSIEGFTQGLYVVIAASGTREEVTEPLAVVKKAVPDAYVKSARVYIGCMH
ncbi:MAG: hypothetical protein H6736_11625 [Alphaproteobacteria bacterium]|nr:hypothetical protein [Alphaproteobacteria bacterium]MCB9692452.1 hypothetical protein [Alphaproteobacteria bacterium]